jgi:hypothetical protein
MSQELAWLFRQSDLILGPVPSKQIVDKLYSGELTPATEVQLLGTGVFTRLSEVPEFRVHVAKAAAKHRIDAQAAQHQAQVRGRLTRAVAMGVGLLVLVGAGVAVLGSYLAVHTPSIKSAEEMAWGDITIDAPTVSRARRRGGDDLVDYQGGPRRPATVARVEPPPRGPAVPGPGAPSVPVKPKLGQEDPEGMQLGEVDEVAINAVVTRNKPTLIPCIKQVAKVGVVAKIPIEFAVSEAGKVTRVWVDNPDFKDPALTECLLKELQKWPFKPGPSGASVNLSFNVGKRG